MVECCSGLQDWQRNCFVLSYGLAIICLFYAILIFTFKPYNDDRFIKFIEQINLNPISSISVNVDTINYFINNPDKEINEKNIIKLERIDSNYNYEYLITNDNKDNHPCGIDGTFNYLFVPNNIDCPINFIELSDEPILNDVKFLYETIKITNSLYLHYSNNDITGYIYNNISLILNNNNIGYKINTILSLYLSKNIYNFSDFKYYSECNKYEVQAAFNFKELRIIINYVSIILLIIALILNIVVVFFRKKIFGLYILIYFIAYIIIIEYK